MKRKKNVANERTLQHPLHVTQSIQQLSLTFLWEAKGVHGSCHHSHLAAIKYVLGLSNEMRVEERTREGRKIYGVHKDESTFVQSVARFSMICHGEEFSF